MNNVTLGGARPAHRAAVRVLRDDRRRDGRRGTGSTGISGVHTHMSNTRNTPVEAIEHYLPGADPRSTRSGSGSGGAGRWRGGDGIVREYEMLTETAVTVLSDRRVGAPYGAQGGAPGQSGPQHAHPRRRRGSRCRARCSCTLGAGDRLRIETPGGGGYGRPE